jgi:hypothetical protein
MKKNAYLLIALLLSYRSMAQGNQSTVSNYSVGQAFTCITIDTNSNVWAGTNKGGLFYLDKRNNPTASFISTTGADASGPIPFSTYIIQTVAADKLGNVWVGHAGNNTSTNGGGGIERLNIGNTAAQHYSQDRNAECLSFLRRDGLATLNVSNIAVDKNNTVWAAQRSHSVVSSPDFILTPGSLSSKRANSNLFVSKSTWRDYIGGEDNVELPYPAYTCNVPISKSPGGRRCESVGCSNSEVWVSVFPYEYTEVRKLPGREVVTQFLPARIIRYDLFGGYLGQLNFDSVGATPGGVFNAIYLTSSNNAWVGLTAGKGVAVKIKGCWTLLNSTKLPDVFLPGAAVNVNAIWGNNQGQVFIGTTNGLIVYNGVGAIDNATSYTLYTAENSGIASNNITGGANEKDSIQWVATNAGISRIVSGNRFSLDENYTACRNPAINAIEDQSRNDQLSLDWHSYKVETVICTSSGPNGSNCNAQYVYELMKSNAALTAPTPSDFPFDLDPFNLALLRIGADQLELLAQRAAVSLVPITSVAFIGIGIIEASDRTTRPVPFGNMLNNNRRYLALQESVNPRSVEACSRYKLYNNATFIVGRIKYNKYLDNLFCDDQLESVEYDPVYIYPDDKNLTITNYTAPGHFLHPGKVERRVIEECGKVKIVTKGTGRQYCGNNPVGYLLGKTNIVVGSILFKNIDERLKRTFAGQ